MKSFQNDIDEVVLQEKINPTDDDTRIMIQQCSESPCLICGNDPCGVAIYSPPDSHEFGAGPGRAKQFFYSLCENCLEAGRSEKEIMMRFSPTT